MQTKKFNNLSDNGINFTKINNAYNGKLNIDPTNPPKKKKKANVNMNAFLFDAEGMREMEAAPNFRQKGENADRVDFFKKFHASKSCVGGALNCATDYISPNLGGVTPIRGLIENAEKKGADIKKYQLRDELTDSGDYVQNQSLDAWEIHEMMRGEGIGNDYYTANENTQYNGSIPKDVDIKNLPIGSILGQGSSMGTYTSAKDGDRNRHAIMVVGWDKKSGEPMVYDSGRVRKISDLASLSKNHKITKITVPKGYEGFTKDNLEKQDLERRKNLGLINAKPIKLNSDKKYIKDIERGANKIAQDLAYDENISYDVISEFTKILPGLANQETGINNNERITKSRLVDNVFGNNVAKPIVKMGVDTINWVTDGIEDLFLGENEEAKQEYELELEAYKKYGNDEEKRNEYLAKLIEKNKKNEKSHFRDSYDSSVGAFAIKDFPEYAKKKGYTKGDLYGITNSNSEELENGAAVALSFLAEKYKNLKDKHPNLKKEELIDLSIVSYNNRKKSEDPEFIKHYITNKDKTGLKDGYLSKVKSYNSSPLLAENKMAMGGKLDPTDPPSKKEIEDLYKFMNRTESELKQKERVMQPGNTANTLGNAIGNVGQYMFGIEDKDLKESPYRPTTNMDSYDKTKKYYTRPGMREDVYRDFTSEEVKKNYNHSGEFDDIYQGLKSNGKDRKHNADNAFPKNSAGYKGMYNVGHGTAKGQFNLGRYKADAGIDDKGKYISFYDTYDWNGLKTDNKFSFYDRIYENEWKEFSEKNKKDNKDMKNGGKIPKYFLGAALSVASTGMNVLSAIKANQQQKAAASQARKDNLNQTREQDLLELQDFEDNGYGLESFYKAGGGIDLPPSFNTTGGKLQRISSDTEAVVGKKHNQGGVKLSNGSEPFAEVEGGETIKDGEKVYSDFLEVEPGVTYADKAKQYAKEKGKLEKGLKDGDSITRGTATRRMQILDSKENALFTQQEQSKTPEMKQQLGKHKFGDVLQAGIPYLDNVVNAGLTLMTPKIQKPTYLKPRKLDTHVNVNNQMAQVNNAVDDTSRAILDNTSNSATARNAIAAARLKGSDQKAGILQRKDALETNIKNQNVRNLQYTDQVNAGKTDAYNAQQTARQGEIQTRISANMANLADDAIGKKNFDESKRYNNEQLAAFRAMYSGNGIAGRANADMLKEILELQKQRLNKG